ncbi:MAG: PQQ-binding-like beta-propeller repeat protein [Planctomycetales bacterium]
MADAWPPSLGASGRPPPPLVFDVVPPCPATGSGLAVHACPGSTLSSGNPTVALQTRLTLLAWLLCFVPPTATLNAHDWPQFRGPTGQGHAAGELPTQWSPTENIVWRHAIPGKGWSSPIVLGRRVVLTTATPVTDDEKGAQSLSVLCLDRESGEPLWTVPLFEQPAGVTIHGKNSHASATPASDGERIYVHFGTHGTAALDLEGNILWKTTDLHYSPVHGNGGSPVLVDDLVIVSCDGSDVQFVAALAKQTGLLRWKTPRSVKADKGFSFGTPLVIEVDGARQLVSQGSDAVMAYRIEDGSELWRVRYPGGFSVVPRPVFGGGLLFVCSGYNTPVLLAIRPAGAAGDVSQTHIAWQLKKGVPHNPSPLLVDQALYLVSDNGVVSCLEAETGQSHWQQRLGGNFSASPLLANGKIYVQSEEGEGYVFAADPAGYQELGRNSIGERALASYAVSGRSVFIRSEGHLAHIAQH